MTTIACNRNEIAADSCVTYDDLGIGTGQYSARKLHRIGKSIYGERGESTAESPLLLEWIRRGQHPATRPVLSVKADFFLLELAPEGIFLWTEQGAREQVLEPNFAIGSGAKVALYCMRFLGMTPKLAVEEASKVDAWTKPPIVVERVKRTR